MLNEGILISDTAPDHLIATAVDLRNRLEDYPVLDEDDYCNREFEAICDAWLYMSMRERVEVLEDHGANIFAARRSELPDSDEVYQYLESNWT